MLCVWPEITQNSHWLENVKFNFTNENFILKNIMLHIIHKFFIKMAQKFEVILSNLTHIYTAKVNVCFHKYFQIIVSITEYIFDIRIYDIIRR